MLKKIFGFLHQYISFRSLRARIFFMILLVGIIPSILMRQGIVRNYEERAVEQRTQAVQAQLKIVADHLINEDYLSIPSSKVIRPFVVLGSVESGAVKDLITPVFWP